VWGLLALSLRQPQWPAAAGHVRWGGCPDDLVPLALDLRGKDERRKHVASKHVASFHHLERNGKKSASRQKHGVYCWKGVIFLSPLRFSLESRHNILTRQSQSVRMCSSSSGWWFRRVCLLECTRHYKHSREYSKRKHLTIVDSKRHPPSLVSCCLLLLQYCIVFYSLCI